MEAIILSRRDIREYDQIVSVYTKEHGRHELLARGIKKITSKHASHAEPYSYAQIEIVRGKDVTHLIKIVPIRSFSRIREHLEKTIAARIVTNILDLLLDIGEPDEVLFSATREWLLSLERAKNSIPLMVDAYVLRLFHCLGFTPVLDVCVVCGTLFRDIFKESLKITHGQQRMAGFYVAGGGLVCSQCVEVKRREGEDVVAVSLTDVSNMALLQKNEWRLIDDVRWLAEEREALHRLIYRFVEYHSEKKIPDWYRVMAVVCE